MNHWHFELDSAIAHLLNMMEQGGQASQLVDLLRITIAELCLGDTQQAATAVQALSTIDCRRISYAQLMAHHLLQKLHFIDKHFKECGSAKPLLQQTRTHLMEVFKAGFTDVSRFVSLYEQ